MKRFLRVLLCGVLGIHLGASADQAIRFDLPEQSIQSGLIEFGLQARITLIVDQNLIAGQRTSKVVGAYSVQDALKKLLSNTDLIPFYIPESQSWVVQKKPEAKTTPIEIESPVVENKLTIEEINIIGRLNYPLRYNTVTNTQLHAGMSYFDSSRFLNVIPRTLIEDQQANDMFDAVKYASGITSSDGLNDSNDDFFIRGFKRHSIYLDGFRLGDSVGSKMLPANIERVEIIKGPSTLLYGQAEPGGVVNFVRKRAEQKSFGEVEIGAGSFGKKFIDMDINNPVQLSDKLDYRLVVSAETKNSESEIEDIERQLVSASATYHLTANTDFSIHYDFQHSEQTDPKDFLVARPFEDFDGDVFTGATLADGVRTKREYFSSDLTLFSAELSHYFSSDWRLLAKYDGMRDDRLGVRTTTETLLNTNGLINPQINFGTVFIFGSQLLVPVEILQGQNELYYRIGRIRSLYDETGYETANRLNLSLEGTQEMGSLVHHISMGIDWHQQNLYKGYLIEERAPLSGQLFPESELDYYLADIFSAVFNPNRNLGEISSQEMRLVYDDFGAFIQDSIELNDQWILNAGGRLVVMQGEHTDITQSEINQLRDYEYWSSQLGLVYKYSDQYSWFGSYSEALKANYHLDDVGPESVDPELSNQFEFGVKTLSSDGRFLSSIALFQINKDNVVDHVIDQGFRTSLGLYSMRARGIDIDFTWQVNSQWDLMGAFSIQSTDILNGPYAGERSNMAADQIASLFVHHQFNERLAFNVGMNYVGERTSRNRLVSAASQIDEIADDFIVSAYATADFSAIYTLDFFRKQSEIKLLIKNLTDTEYYSATTAGVRENFAEGRFFQLSFEVGF